MFSGWWRRWRAERTLARRPIPDELWARTLAGYPFMARRSDADRDALRELATLFLADKEFTGARGLDIDDDMAVAIAAQACLPILRLGLECYDGFKGIVVYPGMMVAQREVTDEDGVVHHYADEVFGESMPGGPVLLSWQHAATDGHTATWICNVVIHEFAHVLQASDGVPALLDGRSRRDWLESLDREWTDFCRQVDAARGTLLDPYGAESIDEFFGVASEVFFVDPEALLAQHPTLYRLLADFYRQDPAAG